MTLVAVNERSARARRVWAAGALLVVLIVLAWANSLHAPFELDDDSSIAANPSIRDLGSWHWLTPPSAHGETVSGRPILNLSFALNYAVGGLDVRGYHGVNVAIHAIAALTLMGLIRRVLGLSIMPGRLRDHALGLAFAVAAFWALHPVQTQAVTYVVQRAESLMALFYLVTLYAFFRGAMPDAPANPAAPRTGGTGWLAFSVVACALGMATKENMVSAPIAVLLLDRAFVAGSWRAAWRARRGYYLALGATWLLLATLVASTGGNRGGSAGFGVGVSWVGYVATQFPAVLRYLALALWPFPLVFEYGAFSVTGAGEIVAPFAMVAVLFGATLFALVRYPRVGSVAAIAWMVLAPTSLVPGTLQMIVEHRLYLPLASVMVLVVVAVDSMIPRTRLRAAASVALALAFVLLTAARNRTYASSLALWRDTVAKRPANPRAHNNLGLALLHEGHVDAAVAEFSRAVALQPNHAFAHANLGRVFVEQRRWRDAVPALQSAVAADPHLGNARINLGVALAQLGRTDEAIAEYRAALRDDPAAIDAQANLTGALIARGAWEDAARELAAVVRVAPDLPEAHLYAGRIAEHAGDLRRAESEYGEALRLRPNFAGAAVSLGNLFARRGAAAEAERWFHVAAVADPSSAEARFAQGNLRAKQQQFDAAIALYREALTLAPEHLQARNNLANCLLALGRVAEAIEQYEVVLRARPGDAAVRQNLEIAREMVRGGVAR